MAAKQKYLLTKNHISKDNLNRLLKQITDNVKHDRKEALDLLEIAKSYLAQRVNAPTQESNDEEDTGGEVNISEDLKAVVSVLKQVQDVNQTLLKAMALIKDFELPKGSASKKKSDPANLFEGLSKLTKGSSNDNEEDGEDDEEA